jgi:hypothetical protein
VCSFVASPPSPEQRVRLRTGPRPGRTVDDVSLLNVKMEDCRVRRLVSSVADARDLVVAAYVNGPRAKHIPVIPCSRRPDDIAGAEEWPGRDPSFPVVFILCLRLYIFL